MFLNSEPIAEDLGLLVLRLGAGGTMFWQHGWGKLSQFTERMDTFSDPIGLGPAFSLGLITFAESICALLVVLGLWTRLSTVPLILGMAVAVFIAHGDDPFGQGEKALLYLTAFLVLFLTGSGRFALDRISFR